MKIIDKMAKSYNDIAIGVFQHENLREVKDKFKEFADKYEYDFNYYAMKVTLTKNILDVKNSVHILFPLIYFNSKSVVTVATVEFKRTDQLKSMEYHYKEAVEQFNYYMPLVKLCLEQQFKKDDYEMKFSLSFGSNIHKHP